MANQEHVKKLLEGVGAWNQWRNEHRQILPDLSGADLSGVDLMEVDLRGAYLMEADLRGADLRGANLMSANLRGADLTSADLTLAYLMGTNLTGADLTSADLTGAHLMGTNLTGAYLTRTDLASVDLRGAHLTGAHLAGTVFSEVDLSQTKGLLGIRHRGPSHINLYTVKLPQDGSAMHFLRGAGVPNEWIDFYRATMQHPIQYHSCFISYSTEDYEIAKRLHADFQNEGVRCWFAPHDLVPGDHFREKIDQAIHMQEKLLLILSTNSMKSSWVQYEVRKALTREVNQNRTILFPISLDGSVFTSPSTWARELREERHIGDFTQWETYEVYKQKFQVLLKQLKSAEVKS